MFVPSCCALPPKSKNFGSLGTASRWTQRPRVEEVRIKVYEDSFSFPLMAMKGSNYPCWVFILARKASKYPSYFYCNMSTLADPRFRTLWFFWAAGLFLKHSPCCTLQKTGSSLHTSLYFISSYIGPVELCIREVHGVRSGRFMGRNAYTKAFGGIFRRGSYLYLIMAAPFSSLSHHVCYPRFTRYKSLRFGERDFQDMEIFLTEDLWLSSKMPYDYTNSGRERDPGFFLSGTAILKGSLDEKWWFFTSKDTLDHWKSSSFGGSMFQEVETFFQSSPSKSQDILGFFSAFLCSIKRSIFCDLVDQPLVQLFKKTPGRPTNTKDL